MAMEARLSLRQTQRLVMTPMLQQAIHLLQLSTVELQELLQKELEENPLLEEAPPDDAPGPEGDGQGEAVPEGPRAEAAPEMATSEAGDAAPDLPFDISEVIFGPPEERSLVQQEEHEDTRYENFVGTPTSLADHLDEQLRLTVVEPDVRVAAEEIIGNLDEDGYLRATVEEIAEKRNLPLPVVQQALSLVHGFDPIGVGARDLRECLLIQLRDPSRAPSREPAGHRDPRAALRSAPALQVPGDRPGAQGGPGACDRGRPRDRDARAEAGTPLRVGRDAVRRAGRPGEEGRGRLRHHPQRGRHAEAPRQLVLPERHRAGGRGAALRRGPHAVRRSG